jgi:hypothetical protein
MVEKQWFLLKHKEKQIRGPVSFSKLKAWAVAAKIGPMDRVSCDNKVNWSRAPMIPELQMDWLVELDDNYLYGPTSIAALKEFISSGEIKETDNIINCLDNRKMTIADCPAFASDIARGHSETDPKIQQTSENSDASVPQAAPSTNPVDVTGEELDRLARLEKLLEEMRNEIRGLKEQLAELSATVTRLEENEIPPDTTSYLI